MRITKLLLMLTVMLLSSATAQGVQQVTVMPVEHGTVVVDNVTPSPSDVVTVTVTPAAGYQIAKADIVAEVTIDPGHANAPRRIQVGSTLDLLGDEPADLSQEATYTFIMPEEPLNVRLSATFSVMYYTVTLAAATFDHGTVTIDKETATLGEQVTLTVTPEEGYELDQLIIATVDNPTGAPRLAPRRANVNYTEGENGTYTFEMPAGNVTVDASFKETIITGVSDLNTDKRGTTLYFDMNGRNRGNTLDGAAHGIYITSDGRKVVK